MSILWYRPQRARQDQTAPPLEKHVACVQKRVISLACVKEKRTREKDSPSKSQSTRKYVQEEKQEKPSDLDFTFQVRVDKPHPQNCATVEV